MLSVLFLGLVKSEGLLDGASAFRFQGQGDPAALTRVLSEQWRVPCLLETAMTGKRGWGEVERKKGPANVALR